MNGLVRRTVRSFVQFMVVMALLLFVPAWTFDYWQAWVFLIAFLVQSILITAYVARKDPKLLERRLSGGPAAEKETAQKIIQTFATITILALFVFPPLDHRNRGGKLSRE